MKILKPQKAARMYDDGFSVAEISEELGCTEKTVREYLSSQGVEMDEKKMDPTGRLGMKFKIEWTRVTVQVTGGLRRCGKV